jgi:hypothetical protein
MTKVVVTSTPFTNTTTPIMAPALLKGVVEQAGFPCRAIDINGIIYSMIDSHPLREEFLRFFYYEEVEPAFISELSEMFEALTDDILSTGPDIVALSLLHYQCQIGTKWLCFHIKQRNPFVSIVIGGYGAFGSGLLDNNDSYVLELKNAGLIDHYITGDGDVSLPEFLKNNFDFPGINSFNWKSVTDLDSFPYPNYDDYDFDLYQIPSLNVLGSRGCVRQCTFCDIHEYWEKFQWRSGQNIFNEMLSQKEKYGIRDFRFLDSLINGNVKEFTQLILLLAEYNRNNPTDKITWSSLFIFRPASQMNEEHWRLTAESGAHMLSVGVESLSEKNREHIKKKFNNVDLHHGLTMAKKYGIKLNFLVIVGYVTETEDDHLEALQWLKDHAEFAKDPIYRLNIGGTLSILPRTWLDRNQESLGVTWLEGKPKGPGGKNHLWRIESTGNDYETRLRRMNEIVQVANECGFVVSRAVIDPQKELENLVNENLSNVDTRQI